MVRVRGESGMKVRGEGEGDGGVSDQGEGVMGESGMKVRGEVRGEGEEGG